MKIRKPVNLLGCALLLLALIAGSGEVAFGEKDSESLGDSFLFRGDLNRNPFFEQARQQYREHGDSTQLEELKIRYLLHALRNSGFTLIRNGIPYDSKKAARHLEKKYLMQKWKIRTAHEFIDSVGSNSWISGEKYRIEFPGGDQAFLGDILMNELNRFESQLYTK
ncbi:MAG TPA: DUF5329 family protein [Candidatus Omnitrophota bacterium]|nr:DUF5329 family protein [Candidatus Omnitrophota bacterium]